MKWIILSFFTFLFWVGLYLFLYLGFSKPVTVEVSQFPPMTLIYKEHIGGYHKINPTIESVEKAMRDRGVHCSATFGEYLDDPNEVDEDRLKSNAGCVFFESSEFIDNLELEDDLKKKRIDERKVVLARFQGSPSIGPMKVYPKINEVIHDQRLVRDGPIVEVYEIQGDQVTTTYLQPVQ